MAEQFGEFIEQERERLNREREEVHRQQRELEGKLDEIERELEAIAAYESAKSRKPQTGKASATGRRQARGGRARSQAPRGSRREALLQTIRENRVVSAGAKSSNAWVSKATRPVTCQSRTRSPP